jgi:hypothetical protein
MQQGIGSSSDDLKAIWESFRPKSPIRVISQNAGNLMSQLEYCCETAAFDLAQELHRSGDELAPLVKQCMRAMLQRWYEVLSKQNLTGIVEIILEDKALPEEEVKQFLTGLPNSILSRITDSIVGSTTGTQALIVLEACRRSKVVEEYTIERDNGRVLITFRSQDPSGQFSGAKFYLDEHFELGL